MERRKRKKPITKMALYLRAMRVSLWLTILFFTLSLLMALLGDANIRPGLQSMLIFVGGNTLGFFAILFLLLSPLALLDINRIKKQEKHFGFSFNDEMKRLDIREFVHTDDEWLILVHRFRIYAYKKGFMTDFGFQRKSFLGNKLESKVLAECADGKARKLSGGAATLKAIQDWALKL